MTFVPDHFDVPAPPVTDRFRLEPLGPQHNESDHAAWTASIDFIHSLPGWKADGWPVPMTLEENLADLREHAAGFEQRREFTYTVLDVDTGEVVGCVYIKPTRPLEPGATEVRSWVRGDRAELDKPLYDVVRAWLADSWPFTHVQYAAR